MSIESNIGNRRLIPEGQLQYFIDGWNEQIKQLGLKIEVIGAGGTYTHTSTDMQDDGRVREITNAVPEGVVYVNLIPVKTP